MFVVFNPNGLAAQFKYCAVRNEIKAGIFNRIGMYIENTAELNPVIENVIDEYLSECAKLAVRSFISYCFNGAEFSNEKIHEEFNAIRLSTCNEILDKTYTAVNVDTGMEVSESINDLIRKSIGLQIFVGKHGEFIEVVRSMYLGPIVLWYNTVTEESDIKESDIRVVCANEKKCSIEVRDESCNRG